MPTYIGKLMDHLKNPRIGGLIQNSEGVGKLSCDVWGYHAPAPVKKRNKRPQCTVYPGSRLSEAGDYRSTEEVL